MAAVEWQLTFKRKPLKSDMIVSVSYSSLPEFGFKI